jgi:hypothetical protein
MEQFSQKIVFSKKMMKNSDFIYDSSLNTIISERVKYSVHFFTQYER